MVEQERGSRLEGVGIAEMRSGRVASATRRREVYMVTELIESEDRKLLSGFWRRKKAQLVREI